MGYSYEAYGSRRLCCDKCGRADGVRKRTCPFKVTGDSIRSASGSRFAVPYCYPPAYCAACFAERGKTAGIHAECRERAATMQAQYDAKEAAYQAGEPMLIAGYGDWAEWVPEGKTGAIFKSVSRGEIKVLIDKAEYGGGGQYGPKLSSYPSAQEVAA